jgi:NADH dehydrogenase
VAAKTEKEQIIMDITIVGGGFGGIKSALELAKDSKNRVTLISDKRDFQYYPALYGAATGRSHLESWVPLGEIFAGKNNIIIQIDTIVTIDPVKKVLIGSSGKEYVYEKCILALGSVTTYFGLKGLDMYAHGIKSAAEIKSLKHSLYTDIAEHKNIDAHYVVIGGGPTGVELAAALGSYIGRLCEHYGVENKGIQIDLVEAAPRILPKMAAKTSSVVLKRLQKLGVVVQTGVSVESASPNEVVIDGKALKTHTVIWTSGVANHPFYKANETHFKFAPNGRVAVDEYMLAAPDVYVIGDNAATPYTGLAQTALHDALFVTANLRRVKLHLPLKKYKAIMPVFVVPVGENWAVVEWHKLHFSGWVASLIRRAADLIGYSDVLPLGQALGVWRADRIMEDDYFAPSTVKK